MKWLDSKKRRFWEYLQNRLWNWPLMQALSHQSVSMAEKTLYADLTNAVEFDRLLEEMQKIRKMNPEKRYFALAEFISIQSKLNR